jgi:NADH-ubiquinone oxidoreductase chain 1
MLNLVVVFLLLMIFVMVGVAFLTLLERKVLGYIYISKGPNKVGFVGIFQPSRDASKLFYREQYFLLFPIILFIIFFLFLGFFFLYWFGCWSLISVILFHLS